MAMLKVGELRAMTDAELYGRIEESRQELFNLRLQRATNKLTNPLRFRHVRRDMARIMTVLREREMAAELTALGVTSADE
jgi:large subunit ribosomal protein L29